MSFTNLLSEVRACQTCAPSLPHKPRPVLRGKPSAKLLIAGQAPGARVHESGKPFTDPSGDRLREWLGIDEKKFYDDSLVAIVPMGFCFPGLDSKGGDLPPRNECAPAWRTRVLNGLNQIELTLLVGQYAQAWHLKGTRRDTLTETVKNWRAYGPDVVPLPHPSWRNNIWIKKNPWFAEELLPHLRRSVSRIVRQ